MVIKTETKYGGSAKENRDGFGLAAEADVNDEQLQALASIGLASLLYRGGASVINKALDVESNSAAEFSDEGATTVASALEAWAQKGAGFKADGENANALGSGFVLSVTASRHEHGTSGAGEPGVMAKQMWEQAKDQPGLRLALGVGEDASDEDGVAAARKFLASLKPAKKEKETAPAA